MSASEIWELSRQQAWRDASAMQVFRAVVLLALVRIALVVLGFERTIRVVRRLSRRPQRGEIRDVELAAAAYRVAAGAAFVPSARCLERSLVLFYQLKRDGVPVVLRLGAHAYPFGAHAWVEYEGQPVNEHRESIRFYRPILELR